MMLIMLGLISRSKKRITGISRLRPLVCILTLLLSVDLRAQADEISEVDDPSTLYAHEGGVPSLVFSPDGKVLASGGHDHVIRLWNPLTGELVNTLQIELDPMFEPDLDFRSIMGIAFSPNGRYLAAGLRDRTVRLFDMTNKMQIAMLRGHTGGIRSVAFSPDGKVLASAGHDSTVRLWDVKTFKEIKVFNVLSGTVGWFVAFSLNGKYIVSNGGADAAVVWDIETGKQLRQFSFLTRAMDGAFGANVAAFSPDSRYLVAGTLVSSGKVSGQYIGSIHLWEITTGKELRTFDKYGGSVRPPNIVFTPNGKYIVSSGRYGPNVWETSTGKLKMELKEREPSAYVVAISPDGRYIASGDYHIGTLRLWDIESGKQVRAFGKPSVPFD